MQQSKKLYKTVLVDPPWDIQQKGGRGADKKYPLMSLEEIRKMPISDLTEKNAHCWLWVTNNALRFGYEILETWGFAPKSILTWAKPRLGLGQYLRNSTEHMILGVKGKAPVQFKGQSTFLWAPAQSHSHKPEEQYAIIERVSPGPYLELFARRPQHGWDVWGNQILSNIRIKGYPVPKYRKKV